MNSNSAASATDEATSCFKVSRMSVQRRREKLARKKKHALSIGPLFASLRAAIESDRNKWHNQDNYFGWARTWGHNPQLLSDLGAYTLPLGHRNPTYTKQWKHAIMYMPNIVGLYMSRRTGDSIVYRSTEYIGLGHVACQLAYYDKLCRGVNH